MKLKLTFLALAFCLLAGMTFGQKGHSSGHRSSGNSTKGGSGKTVHVKTHTKKNGTHVASYKRRPSKHK